MIRTIKRTTVGNTEIRLVALEDTGYVFADGETFEVRHYNTATNQYDSDAARTTQSSRAARTMFAVEVQNIRAHVG